MSAPWGATLLVTLSGMVTLWAVSLWRRDASIVDPWWGPGFVLIAAVVAVLGDGATPRRVLVPLLVAAWGLRLGTHLLWRARGKGEDFRYRAMRKAWGPRFPAVSLVTVFLLQGLLMWIVSLPVQIAVNARAPAELGVLDIAGIALWAVGLTFEAVGDWQLARFKGDPANRERVMDEGLWRYTRHPNYFGDCCVWWGIFVIALATPGSAWTIIGPLAMTVLLVRVSGVPMLERSLRRRRPGYEAYVRRTSAFVPWPPSE
jgi:steroid 5-alpha reductase family enzyme